MAQRKATFFVSPSSDVKIQLGAILRDPREVGHPLNEGSIKPIRKSEILMSEQRDVRTVRSAGRHTRQALNPSHSKLSVPTSATESYTLSTTTTTTFQPTTEYIEDSVTDPNVVSYMESSSLFRQKPLYIVTGIMTARGIRRSGQRGVSDSVSIRDPSIRIDTQSDADRARGGVGSVGWTTKVDWTGQAGDSKTASKSDPEEDFIFAYSLRKIVYQKRNRKTQLREHLKGGLFSTDGDLWGDSDSGDEGENVGMKEQESEEEGIEVVGLEKRDTDAEDLGAEAQPIIDEITGEEVANFLPEVDTDNDKSLPSHFNKNRVQVGALF